MASASMPRSPQDHPTGPCWSGRKVVPSLRSPQDHAAHGRRCRAQSGLRQAGRPGARHEGTGRRRRRPSCRAKLEPLVDGLPGVDRRRSSRISDPTKGWRSTRRPPRQPIDQCRTTLERIEDGLKLLEQTTRRPRGVPVHEPGDVAPAHPLASTPSRCAGASSPTSTRTSTCPTTARWYPFQIAFILLNLPGITKLDHPDRSESPEAVADLLCFPTGGGKTEAYLGLTAYTMGLRRLQGTVAGRSGENGVAVLMRYTLRLLTIQQFQRATALICACEIDPPQGAGTRRQRWGKTPFRIGLWVGHEDHAQLDGRCRRGHPAGRGATSTAGYGGHRHARTS